MPACWVKWNTKCTGTVARLVCGSLRWMAAGYYLLILPCYCQRQWFARVSEIGRSPRRAAIACYEQRLCSGSQVAATTPSWVLWTEPWPFAPTCLPIITAIFTEQSHILCDCHFTWNLRRWAVCRKDVFCCTEKWKYLHYSGLHRKMKAPQP